MSDIKQEYLREQYTLPEMLSEIGGMIRIV